MTIASNIARLLAQQLTGIAADAENLTIADMVNEASTALHGTPWSLPERKFTRKAHVIAELAHIVSRIRATPALAEPVPEVSDKQAARHLIDADGLRRILNAHGIDPQDWDAVMTYLACGGHTAPLRYFIAVYVDYVYCPDCAVTPEEAELLANGDYLPEELFGAKVKTCYAHSLPPLGRAVFVDLEGRDGVSITPNDPADANTARVLQDVINHGIGAFSADLAAGHTIHHALENVIQGWRPMTDQEARAAFNYQDQLKLNKFPRGKCARRMLTLGWHFNED